MILAVLLALVVPALYAVSYLLLHAWVMLCAWTSEKKKE
jgi:hypothetical protein